MPKGNRKFKGRVPQVVMARVNRLTVSRLNRAIAKPFHWCPPDVYFDRNLSGFTEGAMTKAQSAQLKLEHYYKVAVDSAIERNTRYGSMCPYFRSHVLIAHIFAGELSWKGVCKRRAWCLKNARIASCSSLGKRNPRSFAWNEQSLD